MPTARLRLAQTRWLAFGHLVFAVSWATPLHGVVSPGRVSLAHQVADSVPAWTFAFGLTSVLLGIAAFSPKARRRSAFWGHAVGAVVTFAFGCSSITSALVSRPLGSVIAGAAFLLITTWHLHLQRYYKDGA